MFKRNTVGLSILSASALLTICLLAGGFTAQIKAAANQTRPESIVALDSIDSEFASQKGPQGTASNKPVTGIDVVVLKNPGNTAFRTAVSDAEGSFTIGDLAPGVYEVRLECKKCQRMEIGAAGVQFTLAGAKESNFKRRISKQQLVDGVKFTFEMVRKGGQIKGGININGGGSL